MDAGDAEDGEGAEDSAFQRTSSSSSSSSLVSRAASAAYSAMYSARSRFMGGAPRLSEAAPVRLAGEAALYRAAVAAVDGGSGGGTATPPWAELHAATAKRAWITYRSGFPAMDGARRCTSDAGWGCTLRSSQMMLAEALRRLQRAEAEAAVAAAAAMAADGELLRCFADRPCAAAPFSLHSMCAAGDALGVDSRSGEWYAPGDAARMLQRLVQEAATERAPEVLRRSGLRIWTNPVDVAGTIVRDGVRECTTGGGAAGWSGALMLVLTVKVGNESTINAEQRGQVLELMALPQSLGFVGGRPSSSFYFIGSQEERLLYLDPHTVHSCVDVGRDDDFPTESYSCAQSGVMNISDVDPMLCVGFLCTDEADFEALCERLGRIDPLLRLCDVVQTQQAEAAYDGGDEGDDW